MENFKHQRGRAFNIDSKLKKVRLFHIFQKILFLQKCLLSPQYKK